jgi:predicted nuclease of restriction endonuclease-like RecB superfamily
MLTKDLLRVSRRGGGYRPQFVDERREELAARVIGCYQGHRGQKRAELQNSLEVIERDSDDFKLVRGLAKLLERETTWAVRSPLDPETTRRRVFTEAERVGVVTADEREQALARVADRLETTVEAVEQSLYADRETEMRLASVDVRWAPADLLARYNLSLAQTALFDATEVRLHTDDPRALVTAIKRLGLMYEIYDGDDWAFVVTGPDALFRSSRRYGTQFARLLRTVAKSDSWQLTATIDDRGTEREMTLSDPDPIRVPDSEPLVEDSYDSDVERDFATRFQSLDLDWELEREPAPLAAGERVMIPDFAFDWKHGDFRVFFEIMGFWTPEYVSKKLDQLDAVDDVELLVAVDESLGVSEDIETRDHRALTYSGRVRIKDVRNALSRYERELVAESTAGLPDELRPENDVVTLARLAERHAVSEQALAEVSFPDHERVGRTLVRPAVLESLDEQIEAGMTLETVEAILDEAGIDDASATLSALGYRVEWEGLSGGTVREQSLDS